MDTECKIDFTVSAFNDYDHATAILVEGIAKYFILLSQSGGMPPLHNSTAVLAACSHNIDLEWLSHYLHSYGFLYWDMRQVLTPRTASPTAARLARPPHG